MSSVPPASTGERVLPAVRAALLGCDGPVVLAVSGGLDSMVMLDAAARVAPSRIAAVATFDHRSGDHSAEAAAFVQAEAAARRLKAIVGQAARPECSEAAWRAARWTFLRGVATARKVRIATAHTADDQLETVCMRILRGAGARGLAGLLADSGVLRPLLELHRAELAAYAAKHGVAHVDDPTNASVRHLRNRVRRDLLPAIARVRPEFAADIARLAHEARDLRRVLDRVAEEVGVMVGPGEVSVGLAGLARMRAPELDALGPALAARAGIILDRRGTRRLSEFILRSRTGSRMQLSGGGEVVRRRNDIIVRQVHEAPASEEAIALSVVSITGRWRFHQVVRSGSEDQWAAPLPADRALTVRGWRPGDRMRAAGSRAARRVKRFFSDAGIAGPEREGWPVVLADGEIVWIPGVRRSDAATDRSGRPVLRYRCERNDV